MIGPVCPVCGGGCGYREIEAYFREVRELWPQRSGFVPVARFQCRGKREAGEYPTFSMLPYQLVPYHRYTLGSMVMAMLLWAQYRRDPDERGDSVSSGAVVAWGERGDVVAASLLADVVSASPSRRAGGACGSIRFLLCAFRRVGSRGGLRLLRGAEPGTSWSGGGGVVGGSVLWGAVRAISAGYSFAASVRCALRLLRGAGFFCRRSKPGVFSR